LRDLQTKVTPLTGSLKSRAIDCVEGDENILRILDDIFNTEDTPRAYAGNRTDLVSNAVAPIREKDFHPPPHRTGGGFKNPWLRIGGLNFQVDPLKGTFVGDAKATFEIGTDFPASFDSPTEIALKVTDASLSPKQIDVVGRATVYKAIHADFTLHLKYNALQLAETVGRCALQRKLTRSDAEQALRTMSFDMSSDIYLGGLPLSLVRLSASSLLPLHRPVKGATDDTLPVQFTSLPDRTIFTALGLVVPPGVFFDFPVPGFGAHYCKYSRTQGVSATGAALAKPDLEHLGQVQTFGYIDLHYAKRMSSTVDIDVGLTYTYSPARAASLNDPLQLQYLHARSKDWVPASQDNVPPDVDRSGHNIMFSIKGTFEKFGGR
jgi:hypothetical protein